MIIGCSDSRVDPSLLTNSAPGDIFIVRNVANLVPVYEDDKGQHGVSAALEYAVCYLKIEHIIVLGHSNCGGIRALMADRCSLTEWGFISHWMAIAAPAREQVLAEFQHKEKHLQQRAAEYAAILVSLENLRSFPFIAKSIAEGQLSLHAWYFDLEHGELLGYNRENDAFQNLSASNQNF